MSWTIPIISLALVLSAHVVRAQDARIGELSTDDHGVSGTLFAVDDRTLRIENFSYDGQGPAGVFWLNSNPEATDDGRVLPFKDSCEESSRLPAYSGETVILELPADLTLADVRYFSVWCRDVSVLFGGIEIPASIASSVPTAEAKCANPASGAMSSSFPVQSGWNCEPLNPRFQVRWQVVDTDLQVELVARMNDPEYLAFGPSGDDSSTTMDNSDVVVAYRRGDDDFVAVDYHLESRTQCSSGVGVCPDIDFTGDGGANSITQVSGNASDDMVRILYTRPVAASESIDRPVLTDGETFITWAIGPRDGDVVLRHKDRADYAQEDFMIEFGRPASNACPRDLVEVEKKPTVSGFKRPFLNNVTEITARIGPSGGNRGVRGITGGQSWGIAWYMSDSAESDADILIPAIGVERGKTYNFTVYGGRSTDASASFHPLYITSNEAGGYASLSPAERANETVYAGIQVDSTDADGGVVNFTATASGSLCSIKAKGDDVTDEVATWEDYFGSLNTSCTEDDKITENPGKLTWTVPEDAPDLLYYQCVTHRLLGYKIVVFDAGKVDEETLEKENGGTLNAVGTTPPVENSTCEVQFQSKSETFQDCNLDIGGGVELYFTISDGILDTLFRAKREAGGYVAFGWGFTEMVGSTVAIAYRAANESSVIFNYVMTAKLSTGVTPTTANMTDLQSDFADGFVAGRFSRSLNATGLPTLTIGNVDVIWAIGTQPSSNTTLQQHARGDRNAVRVNLANAREATGSPDLTRTFRAHGVMMGVAWFLLAPIAIIAMRFFKRFNPGTFQVHRVINTVVALLTVIAFFLVATRASHSERAHRGIGYVVFILTILQVIAGMARPQKETPLRRPWYLAHAITGSLAVILGTVNGYIGLNILDNILDVPNAWFYICGSVTGVVVLVFALPSDMSGRFSVQEQKGGLEESGGLAQAESGDGSL